MGPDGNGIQNSYATGHGGHSTMHRVPPMSGGITIYLYSTTVYLGTTTVYV